MDFLLQNLFQKGFQLLMMTAKKFYVSSLLSHPRKPDMKTKPFCKIFLSRIFSLDTYVSLVIDILEPFRKLWMLFQATQSFNWHFELCISVIVFTIFFLSNFYVPSKKSASKRFFAKEILILYFNFILPFYQLNIHNNLLVFGVIFLFLEVFSIPQELQILFANFIYCIQYY